MAGRTDSLGAWCSGFLSGFGLGFDNDKQTLSSEITEGMEDLASIAQISFDEDDEEPEGYNAEASYIELVEYVRLAAMMVFSEFNIPTESTDETVPKLH